MKNLFAGIAGIVAALFLLSRLTSAQQPTSSTEHPSAAANEVDPSVLNAAPTFGQSGPVTSPRAGSAKETATLDSLPPAGDEKATSPEAFKDSEDSEPRESNVLGWHPRLRVTLRTQKRESSDGAAELFFSNSDWQQLQSDDDEIKSSTVNQESHQRDVILLCDTLTVNVDTPADKPLVYTFSCVGKFAMKIHSNIISGKNLRFDGDLLTMQNAVLQMNERATMKAETLKLSMGIIGVKVDSSEEAPAAIKSRLQPIPDPIGGGKDAEDRRPFLKEIATGAST
jgi:hypothetical protein